MPRGGDRRSVNIVGKEIGAYTVVARAPDPRPGAYWLCRCKCGAERVVKGAELRRGKTRCRSCAMVATHASVVMPHVSALSTHIFPRVCDTCGASFRGTAKQKYCCRNHRPSYSRKGA